MSCKIDSRSPPSAEMPPAGKEVGKKEGYCPSHDNEDHSYSHYVEVTFFRGGEYPSVEEKNADLDKA